MVSAQGRAMKRASLPLGEGVDGGRGNVVAAHVRLQCYHELEGSYKATFETPPDRMIKERVRSVVTPC